MRRSSSALGALALGFVCLGLAASEFSPLATVAKSTWADKHHVGVICDAASDKKEILALSEAMGTGTTITVVDTRDVAEVSEAVATLRAKHVDYVVLMPADPVFHDGGFGSTFLIRDLSGLGIPSVGTTARAVRQGAAFAIGEATGGQLLVSDKLIGHISVLLPDRGTYLGGSK
ncbi:hypothetical protein [Geothrix paludis]|uniref:hypothetical protein n=1 Tax=Geothrix paludis TaxID=2922722 RepID=UPI001FAC2B43|nr:hypothetical protein [Geothrix paludis]